MLNNFSTFIIFSHQNFMNKYVCWEPQYAFEKIFTLITRWQLLHLPNLTLDERLSMTDLFIPDSIKKIRNISYKERALMSMIRIATNIWIIEQDRNMSD